MSDEPKRPWWRRKRWVAAAAVVAFPFAWEVSSGPAMYAAERGWPGAMQAHGVICGHLFVAEDRVDRWTGGGGPEGRGVSNLTMRHREWWQTLAVKHAATSD